MAAGKSGSRKKGSQKSETIVLDLFRTLAGADGQPPYGPDAIAAGAGLAHDALCRHRRGHAVVSLENRPALVQAGRPVTAITVVNDNMPFLFDSVMGEINETCGELLFVAHPVLEVTFEAKGICDIHGIAKRRNPADGRDLVSMIQIHVAEMDEADMGALRARLEDILKHVRHSVHDWRDMLIRLDHAISVYRHAQDTLDRAATEEAAAFLEWLRDDNFTFLGMREYVWQGDGKTGTLKRKSERGLGILHDPDLRVLRRGGAAVTTTPQIREFMAGPDPLIVTKANIKSVVHRRAYLDYIGVKTFDRKGMLTGELRIVGLFTGSAYTHSVMRIPFIRSKVQQVMADLGFDMSGHSGKALINILETFPRDELFQIDLPTLESHARAILALGERPRLRVLPRPEKFGRYVSVIIYVPRDRYDSQVRERLGHYLAKAYDGRLSAYYPDFPEGTLARVHFIIGRDGTEPPKVDVAKLEADIRDLVRTWEDELADAARENGYDHQTRTMAARFPADYRAVTPAAKALHDATLLAAIAEDRPFIVDFYRNDDHAGTHADLKIFHRGEPVSLSGRVPALENMGLRVIAERTFQTEASDGTPVFIHDMEVESAAGRMIDLDDEGRLLEDTFAAASRGAVDDDAYNGLSHSAGLTHEQIVILRAYGRYQQQAGSTFGQPVIASALNRYPDIARDLYNLFDARFDPAKAKGRDDACDRLRKSILGKLDNVPGIDEDTILRRYLTLIDATMRTNRYAVPVDGVPVRQLAVKLDPRAIPFLPAPRPAHEIFVYGLDVEGVHLRFGPVARGGLRWSDRLQDYRTEVLGLVKAQQVKNAVIVPVGAKGGFVPKALPANGSREEIFEAGRAAYKSFISSLLSVTDNLDGNDVVPPKGVQRLDGDDPYFVVAADKGTATFSDTANAISQAYGFWLDDAFASGGSAGYDHKKMGITARGAWEAVKRHFREMDRDIQTQPFTVAGVGDMSGDVFGNGMLLSPCIRLVAAFDHRDIFIDPDPDPETSFAERKRVFDLGRSSWQDYNQSFLSKGGGVFPRNQKMIRLPQEAAEAIGLDKTEASPNEIMSAILTMRVDLLWFGGIGTYIRASSESNADAGDRANDAIRVTAADLHCKVIGEGANLGLTQRARIEFGLNGGRCNSDAIDNSAGVNSSDVEVNIKIALAAAMRDGKLSRKARNTLLEKMTGEVADLVLETNYDQTLCISQTESRGMADLAYQARLMEHLENRHLLDRKVELLPDPKALSERQARGDALTRAEIGVLVSYAKLVLFSDIMASPLPSDPHFEQTLIDYFPAEMQKKYAGEIRDHRLRAEIIATELANDVINRGGPAFVIRQQDMTGRSAAEAARAFAISRDGFGLDSLYEQVDALDNVMSGRAQLSLYGRIARTAMNATAWQLRNGDPAAPVAAVVDGLLAARKALDPNLASLLPAFMKERLADRQARMKHEGCPADLAKAIAMLGAEELIPDIMLVADAAGAALDAAAKSYFGVTDLFRLGRIEDAARAIATGDYYDGLALSRAGAMIDSARRGISISVLADHGGETDPVSAWKAANEGRIHRTRERIQALLESGDLTVSRMTVAAGLMGDLAGS
ncbi:NAD-glutamate dehydrogenase [Zhengella mangrovi]|uniref:NAD-glutamate dehydrogenase n=1 Tax=Zhengella mangrovi TaxID=1982044 RepID=A0A2G1QU94_9HYPH|nr:NAD-glutamate dehydrogenase [Zhengella mangrovi]PHP69126.1 NAD-glutamate dehydrogenase [Zhengella mangrovi]